MCPAALLPLLLFWCNQIFLCRQSLLCGKFNLRPLGSYIQQAWTSNFTRLLIPGTLLVIWLPLKTDSKLKEAHTSLQFAFSYVSWSTSRQPPACSLKLSPNSPLPWRITKSPNFLVGCPSSLDPGYSFADGCALLTLWLTSSLLLTFLTFNLDRTQVASCSGPGSSSLPGLF